MHQIFLPNSPLYIKVMLTRVVDFTNLRKYVLEYNNLEFLSQQFLITFPFGDTFPSIYLICRPKSQEKGF